MFGSPPPSCLRTEVKSLRWRLDSWQEVRHRGGGRNSVSSFCFAVLTQADVHPRMGHRLVGVVVVGKELLPKLALVVKLELKRKRR